jgi:ribosomal protein S18 acetylase RimI-like enzyme
MGREERGEESPDHQRGAPDAVHILVHGRGAWALRLGLSPDFRPVQAIQQLQRLMNGHAFWAQDRPLHHLRQMVRNSAVCVTAWRGRSLVGFGRATSDGLYRATIWDLVVDSDVAGRGVGRSMVERLLNHPALASCERVYLMTTNSAGFYQKMGFEINQTQVLMIKTKSG